MVVLAASSWHGACDICTDWQLHGVARGVLARYLCRVPVQFVDITGLSELHKDAHTAVHTLQGKLLTLEQQADPKLLWISTLGHWQPQEQEARGPKRGRKI